MGAILESRRAAPRASDNSPAHPPNFPDSFSWASAREHRPNRPARDHLESAAEFGGPHAHLLQTDPVLAAREMLISQGSSRRGAHRDGPLRQIASAFFSAHLAVRPSSGGLDLRTGPEQGGCRSIVIVAIVHVNGPE